VILRVRTHNSKTINADHFRLWLALCRRFRWQSWQWNGFPMSIEKLSIPFVPQETRPIEVDDLTFIQED
jgi:hypothetical protein